MADELPKPDTDAQRAWDGFEERRRRGRAKLEKDARRENADLMSSAYADSEPKGKPEPKPSIRTYATPQSAAQARREAEQRIRDSYADDD